MHTFEPKRDSNSVAHEAMGIPSFLIVENDDDVATVPRLYEADFDEIEEPGNFFRGLAFALPLSLLLWGVIVGVVWFVW